MNRGVIPDEEVIALSRAAHARMLAAADQRCALPGPLSRHTKKGQHWRTVQGYLRDSRVVTRLEGRGPRSIWWVDPQAKFDHAWLVRTRKLRAGKRENARQVRIFKEMA